jgi:pSer/pThr/pTyr-binding forkhead associated (FHA) protein
MVDNTTGQIRQAQGTSPTDYEALLVQVVDPALRLHIAETRLSQIGDGRTQGQPLRIGRQAGADLLLNEGSVSRQHAEISYAAGHYLLRDLGSTSGTFVNEQPLDTSRPYVLQPNDILRFGNIVRLKFLLRVIPHPKQMQSPPPQNDRRDNAIRPSDTTMRMPPVPRADDDWLLNENPMPAGVMPHANPVPRTDLDWLLNENPAPPAPRADTATSTYQEQLKKAPALVIVPEGSAQNGIPPQIHFLNPGQRTTIGREEDNTIILTDPTASRHHAEVLLYVQNGNNFCYVRDLQSSYGTLVNQTKIAGSYLLSHGDRIKLGSTRIFYIDLQAGREPTTKSVGIRMGTRVNQNNTGPETNIILCPNCGIANARVARFCAGCSTLIGPGVNPG